MSKTIVVCGWDVEVEVRTLGHIPAPFFHTAPLLVMREELMTSYSIVETMLEI